MSMECEYYFQDLKHDVDDTEAMNVEYYEEEPGRMNLPVIIHDQKELDDDCWTNNSDFHPNKNTSFHVAKKRRGEKDGNNDDILHLHWFDPSQDSSSNNFNRTSKPLPSMPVRKSYDNQKQLYTLLRKEIAHMLRSSSTSKTSTITRIVCTMAALNLILQHDPDNNTLRIILEQQHLQQQDLPSTNGGEQHDTNKQFSTQEVQEFLHQLSRFHTPSYDVSSLWSTNVRVPKVEVRVAQPQVQYHSFPMTDGSNLPPYSPYAIVKKEPAKNSNRCTTSELLQMNTGTSSNNPTEATVMISSSDQPAHVKEFEKIWNTLEKKRDLSRMYEDCHHSYYNTCATAFPKRRRIFSDSFMMEPGHEGNMDTRIAPTA